MTSFFKLITFTFLVLSIFKSFGQETNEIWRHTLKSHHHSAIDRLEVDDKGDIYLLCHTQDTVWTETVKGKGVITSNHRSTYFIEKLDSNGNLIWIVNLSNEFEIFNPKIAVNSKGGISLCFKKIVDLRTKSYCVSQYNSKGELVFNNEFIKTINYKIKVRY